jgi:HEPN domain-containing protein
MRVREARILLRAKEWSGAYYLGGYAVECALKACIARQFKRYELPDKNIVEKSYTHSLSALVRVAGLEPTLLTELGTNTSFYINWNVVKDWTVESRYGVVSDKAATDFLKAVTNRQNGILRWVRARW